jgi:hypothetical protein
MSEEARDRRAAGDEQPRGDDQTPAGYEPPRIEDIPADSPAVTAAGAQGVVILEG